MAQSKHDIAVAVMNQSSGGTASSMIKKLLEALPLDWILPVVFSKILDTIKNPESKNAKALEKVLIPFGQALAEKYKGRICE